MVARRRPEEARHWSLDGGATLRGRTRPTELARLVGRHAPMTRAGCSHLLASCDMRTLYLRNVPDDVSERLATLAAREGLSVSSFAVGS